MKKDRKKFIAYLTLIWAVNFCPRLSQAQYNLDIISVQREQPSFLTHSNRTVTYNTKVLRNIRLTNNQSASERPDIETDSSGTGYVVWQDNRDGNWEIYFCVVNEQGRKLTSDIRVTNTNGASEFPEIAVDASSNSHIVWKEGSTVHYSKVDPAGMIVISPKEITGGNSEWPQIAVHPDGIAGITWTKQNGIAHEIGFRKLDAAGNLVGNEIVLDNEFIVILRIPCIDSDGKGNFYVGYEDYTGVGLFTKVVYQKIKANNQTECCGLISNRDSAKNPAFALVDDNRGCSAPHFLDTKLTILNER